MIAHTNDVIQDIIDLLSGKRNFTNQPFSDNFIFNHKRYRKVGLKLSRIDP